MTRPRSFPTSSLYLRPLKLTPLSNNWTPGARFDLFSYSQNIQFQNNTYKKMYVTWELTEGRNRQGKQSKIQ